MKRTGSIIGGIAIALIWSAGAVYAQPAGRGGNAPTPAEVQAQTSAAQSKIHAYLKKIGYAQLARRAQTVAAFKTKAEAEQRQAEVRRKIIELVGGLPKASGAVAVKQFATIEEDGFHIENIAYESFPGYWVTANVYVPAGAGPFPAMIIAPGHGAGKSSQFNWGANFAHAGILTLSIDPMGQGERMQHLDTRVTQVVVENTLVSYRMALAAGLHKNLSEVAMPGVLNHYDVGDLLAAISPRPVSLVNPVNAMGQPARDSVVSAELSAVFETDRNLGTPQRVRLLKRGFRDPLPIK